MPHFRYYYNTYLSQSHTSRGLHITIFGGLSHSSMLQTLAISADRCLTEMHNTTVSVDPEKYTVADITTAKIKEIIPQQA